MDLSQLPPMNPSPQAAGEGISTRDVLRQVEAATAESQTQTADEEPGIDSGIENRPDDLSAIRGIGDVYEQRLYRAGIFTWHQLSRTDTEILRRITKALPSSNPQSWIEQARELALAARRVGAVYDGPVPDDLTRIEGIDQVYEGELYAAGILTFEQLAERAPDELQRIIPAHLAGDRIDFESWIAQADILAEEK